MIASTPIEGTHYFVDVIGGLAVSACTLLAVGWIRRAILRHRADSARGRSAAGRLATAPD